MKKFFVAAALAATFSLASATTIVVDDFSTSQATLTNTGVPPSTQSSSVAIAGGITRQITLNSLGNSGPVSNTVQVAGGALDITNGVQDDAQIVVTYTLPSALAIPGGSTNLLLNLVVIASDGNPTVVSVGGIGSGTFNIPGNTFNTTVSFSLSGPPVGPGSLTLTFDGAAGWDLGIDSLGVSFDPPGEVPEPSSYAMMGAGLVGFYMLRRKR